MKLFRWQGINAQGFRTKGECLALDKAHLRTILQTQKIVPLRISKKFQIGWRGYSQITSGDITEFTRELSVLITAGIPLASALKIIIAGVNNNQLLRLITSLTQQIEAGHLFYAALSSFPKYFDATYAYLIQVGEQSGTLATVCNYLAHHREKMARLKAKIKKALYYPIAVLVVSLVVTVVLLLLVIPQFVRLFQTVNAELPFFTQVIIQLAKELYRYGWLVLLLPIILYASMRWGSKHFLKLHRRLHYYLLYLPFFGKVLRHAVLARCFYNLAITLHSGLPLLAALDLAVKVAGNVCYEQGLLEIARQVQSGKSLSTVFHKNKIFPARVGQLVSVGEEAGCLDKMFTQLSEYYEEKVDYFVANLNQLLEPAIMIFLCLLVGSIVIAMYLPIFRLGTVI
jgi:type IV pilus assembly protein PilC